jgi:hypothetical protein
LRFVTEISANGHPTQLTAMTSVMDDSEETLTKSEIKAYIRTFVRLNEIGAAGNVEEG